MDGSLLPCISTSPLAALLPEDLRMTMGNVKVAAENQAHQTWMCGQTTKDTGSEGRPLYVLMTPDLAVPLQTTDPVSPRAVVGYLDRDGSASSKPQALPEVSPPAQPLFLWGTPAGWPQITDTAMESQAVDGQRVGSEDWNNSDGTRSASPVEVSGGRYARENQTQILAHRMTRSDCEGRDQRWSAGQLAILKDKDERRRARNRKAQRVFRERQKNRILGLLEEQRTLRETIHRLEVEYAELNRENQLVRQCVKHIGGHGSLFESCLSTC